MNLNEEKIAGVILNLSGLLIPISLASITLVGADKVIGIPKNILMFSIPSQVILLIASLWISLGIFNSKEEKNATTHLRYAKLCFFGGLIIITISHIIILFSQT